MAHLRIRLVDSNEQASTSIEVRDTCMVSCGEVQTRFACHSDVEFLVQESEHFSNFYATKKPLFPGHDEAERVFKALIDQHLVVVSEVKGERTGFIAGYYLSHPFNSKIRLLAEVFWWVTEKHRKGRSALALLNAFVNFGKKNADWITFTLEQHSPVNRRALEKRGFIHRETGFLLET